MCSSVIGNHEIPHGRPVLDCPSALPIGLPREDQACAFSAVLRALNGIRQVLGSGLEEP